MLSKRYNFAGLALPIRSLHRKIVPRWSLCLLLLVVLAGFAPLQAQIVDDFPEDLSPAPDFNETEVGIDDTTALKKVAERTEFLDPLTLMNGGDLRSLAGYDNTKMMYPDDLERLSGHIAGLGQWGKPYLRYLYGTESSNFDQGIYINPLTGAEDAYTLDPEHGVRYFDTRTPYFNAYFGQGKGDALQMRADVSQNVGPRLNFAGMYYRRKALGVYSNFVTDHNSVALSSNFHTLNNRYLAFVHYMNQNHADQINGGVDVIFPDSILFDQGSQPVMLDGANLHRNSVAVAFRHFYSITGDSSSGKHRLLVYNGAMVDKFENGFGDLSIQNGVNTGQFPVYPTIGTNTSLADAMTLRRLKIDAGLSYRLTTPIWKIQQRLEVATELMRYKRFVDWTNFNRNTLLWKGTIDFAPENKAITFDWTYRQTRTNLFNPESYIETNTAYRFPKWQLDYVRKVAGPALHPLDSTSIIKTYRPMGLVMHTLTYGRNPTLQQSIGRVFPNNNFVPNANFNNRRIRHFSIGLEITGKSKWTNTGEQRGNYARLSAFSTTQNGMIYFSPAAQGFIQAAPQEFVGYYGGELKARLHWKNLFIETETVMQGFGTNSSKLETQFLKTQSKFYSRSSVFYENRNLKFTPLLRFGLDYHYFSMYDPQYFDPVSQAFYPQGETSSFFQYGYPRADVWANTQIKKVFIYVKFINLLEGLPDPGYFTTLGYPMPVRQLQLGLNWTFFD